MGAFFRPGHLASLPACLPLAAWLAVACSDPVHDEQVAALGPEQAGVPAGPLHRPGQPCVTCHGALGPASQKFTVAGTVYAVGGESVPAVAAQVQIEDSNGNFYVAVTNSAGNFFVPPDAFTPVYPTQMTVTSADGNTVQQMLTHVGRDASCADCHVNPESRTSPGTVYLVQGMADGGTE